MAIQIIQATDKNGAAWTKQNSNNQEIVQSASMVGNILRLTKESGGFIDVALPVSSGIDGSEILSAVGSISQQDSLDYSIWTVTSTQYLYLGVNYTALSNDVQNDFADSEPRYDVIYVDALDNTIKIKKGTASLDPELPSLLSSELILGVIYVKADANPAVQTDWKLVWTVFESQAAEVQIKNRANISLDDLTDVVLSTLAEGQVISYDGTNWTNKIENFVKTNGTGNIKNGHLSVDFVNTGVRNTLLNAAFATVPVTGFSGDNNLLNFSRGISTDSVFNASNTLISGSLDRVDFQGNNTRILGDVINTGAVRLFSLENSNVFGRLQNSTNRTLSGSYSNLIGNFFNTQTTQSYFNAFGRLSSFSSESSNVSVLGFGETVTIDNSSQYTSVIGYLGNTNVETSNSLFLGVNSNINTNAQNAVFINTDSIINFGTTNENNVFLNVSNKTINNRNNTLFTNNIEVNNIYENYNLISSNTTLFENAILKIFATENISIDLPANPYAGTVFTIINVDGLTKTIGGNGNFINGLGTYISNQQYDIIKFYYDEINTAWFADVTNADQVAYSGDVPAVDNVKDALDTLYNSIGASKVYTNGLTLAVNDVKLGGTLTENTVITAGAFDFTITKGSNDLTFNNDVTFNLDTVSNRVFAVSGNGGENISLNNQNVNITDGNAFITLNGGDITIDSTNINGIVLNNTNQQIILSDDRIDINSSTNPINISSGNSKIFSLDTLNSVEVNDSDGVLLTSNSLPTLQILGGTITAPQLAGSASRILEVDASGNFVADKVFRSPVLMSNYSSVSITGTTEQSLYGAIIGNSTIEANDLSTGKVLNFKINRWISTTNPAGTLTLKIYIGASSVFTISGIALSNSLSNQPFEIDANFLVTNTGISGTMIGSFRYKVDGATYVLNQQTATFAIDTTIANNIDVTAQFSNTGNTISGFQGLVEMKS